jgi:hypothetical protein
MVLLALAGCPKPDARPEPPGTAMSVVFIFDPETETPEQAAVYNDPNLIEYCETSGHELRIAPVNARDENGSIPEYYRPAFTKAGGIPKPCMVLGRDGKAKEVYPLPASSQQCIVLIDNLRSSILGLPPDTGDWFFANGHWRKLGCLPGKPGAETRWPGEKSEKLIPESKWKDVNFDYHVKFISNQNGFSSCSCDSSTNGMVASAQRMGLPFKRLSVVDLYSRVNGGRDAGASLEDCLVEAKIGVCDLDFASDYGVTKTNHKKEWEKDRVKHAVSDAYWCPTAAHIASAVQRYRPVIFGTMITDKFSPDKDGVIGPQSGRARGGHAMLITGMKKINGEWYFRVINSWGENWSNSGKCWLHISWVNEGFGAWAIASLVSPSDETVRSILPALTKKKK